MSRLSFGVLMALLGFGVLSCNNNKPKPVSDTVGRTAVMLNGKKDSVINNPQKNYGNATIAEPCVKCLLQVIQADDNYKKSTLNIPDVKYIVNYVKTAMPEDTVSEVKATNALRVDVINKSGQPQKLSAFLYDNSKAKLYFLSGKSKNELKVDSVGLMKIRNSCYWGVASGK
ncbi:hypothetical protein DYU05_04495 [Mucilaginibacter terrenus]|uniref:Lipoprotein n=1 Tax=Mucilaginibacter terrenus TaxID=2482727 RepID=A0A3E2NVD0_9SPHI|nr:hypothetical protein [Mucilaginibacter terrenus]RFZ84871.1 hypothetical protein DYU05_04495 [Mucilaginibacter terrenus]